MSDNALLAGVPPCHPGAILRLDVLPALDRPKAQIARLLGISRQTLHFILTEEQSITASMALRLGKLLGNGPELWLNLQQAYDLSMERKRLESELRRIPTIVARRAP